ncbi:MAG: hypothetical protein JNM17_11255, partial [Archangium sp.]|nr:hypothetical protein [Archangium sp.]
SSVQLAEFLQEIYAERLAREQEEGRLMIETAESAVGNDSQEVVREKATPSLDAVKRQTTSMRSATSSKAAKRNQEETRAESPGRSQSNSKKRVDIALDSQRPIPALGDTGNPHTEASMPTQSDGRGRGAMLVVIAVAVVAVLGIGGFVMFGPAKTASFSVDSMPPGAKVSGPKGELCVTPCRLDDVEPGELALTIEKADFKPEKRALVLKAGVHESLAAVVLEPLNKGPTVISNDPPVTDVKPPEPVVVMVEEQFISEPPGALVTLGAEELGPAPISRKLEKGSTLEVKLELKNFQTVTETFVVGDAAEGVHKFVLKAVKNVKPPNNNGNVKQPEVKNNPPPSATKGTVRFIVKPWATVECPQVRFKNDTPFADQQWPAGEYSCTFTNPEFATQTKLVRVEPDKTVKVSVTMQ